MERNAFLTAIPAVLPVHRVHVTPGQILHEAGSPIEQVYFPYNAVVSLLVRTRGGHAVETALMANQAAVGAGVALNGGLANNTAVVQIGGDCAACSVAAFREAATSHPSLVTQALYHELEVSAQAHQAAACSLLHDLDSRLARWLLHVHDLAGADELHFTQDDIAQLLGVRRTSLSIAAVEMQKGGLIEYRRGRIVIKDAAALRDRACECYEVLRTRRARHHADVAEH